MSVGELRDLLGREPVYQSHLTFDPTSGATDDDCLCIVDVPATLGDVPFRYDAGMDEYEVQVAG